MTIVLVRHAKAGSREKWRGPGPDSQRPLSPKGWRQAEGLVDVLKGYAPSRLISSPYVRCVQSLEPLAAALGLDIETADELAEGADPVEALALMHRLGDVAAVLCTHGDIVQGVLGLLAEREGLDLPRGYPCAKGSTWVITDESGRLEASYLPPPTDG